MKTALIMLSVFMLCVSGISLAQSSVRSDFDPRQVPLVSVRGVKYPNSPDEGREPVETRVWGAHDGLGGFDELIPYLLPSPDQDEAGSCLYMANTGAAEWWLARLSPKLPIESEGPGDLSERHLMNLAGIEEAGSPVKNWKTDTIFLFNDHGNRGVLNSEYRFTKGWYKNGSDGNPYPSKKGASGALYGTMFNWISQLDQIEKGYVDLPVFDRTVIFADPESNQWNVGVAPPDIAEQVKESLRIKKAPVQVIYNHFGYWHAVMIVGFNDEMESDRCVFVERARKFYPGKVSEYTKELKSTTDPNQKIWLVSRIAKFEKTIRDLEKAYAAGGGCMNRGVFYVRDSIYADEDGPLYDYDKSTEGDESPYSKTVVVHEYEWLRYLSNHVTQITASFAN